MNKQQADERNDWAGYWAKRQAMPLAQKNSLRDLSSRVANLRVHEAQTETAVYLAREAGVPWSYIADELGVSKQGAQQRYAAGANAYAERERANRAADHANQLDALRERISG